VLLKSPEIWQLLRYNDPAECYTLPRIYVPYTVQVVEFCEISRFSPIIEKGP